MAQHPPRLDWVEPVKGLAMVWIFVNHVAERLFGYPHIANPTPDWPPLIERLAQLYPLTGLGLWTVPVNALRYLGWMGDQGVQVFLILSGFGLTWGLLSKPDAKQLTLGDFYGRRLARLFPLWWGAHALFATIWVLTGWGLAPTERAFYLSAVGFRATPALFYYFSPAWWYFGLLLQLYLLYPFLWKALGRLGPGRLLLSTCVVAFIVRAIGLVCFEAYLDAWQRGAVFITRLPEFVLGISLAGWLFDRSGSASEWLVRPRVLLLAGCAYIAGLCLSLTLMGMTFAPFLLGFGALVLLFVVWRVASRVSTGSSRLAGWTGQHSYSLYLIHHPAVLALVPLGLASAGWRVGAAIGLATVLTVALAVALEWTVDRAVLWWASWRKTASSSGLLLRVATGTLVLLAALLGGEQTVRQFAPQEVLGWGERPSLVPDDAVGWHLRPSSTTRLRWESYDYTVIANELGFPGPSYPEERSADTFRVLVTGDAFSSAEGVNTDQAWPRRLETELSRRMTGQKVEVLNFAITGYGPNQYAAVVRTFAPRFKPDLVVVEVFVNEFQDVLWSDDDFRLSIGFGERDPDGWYGYARLEHLRRFLQLKVGEPLRAALRHRPERQGYFLGNFQALERDWPERKAGTEKLAQRLQEIRDVAGGVGARIVIAMVPAPVQVCSADQLKYFPHYVNLADTARFDLDLPQRIVQELADSLGIAFFDLRPTLEELGPCPYQLRNMHWTVPGHARVAEYLGTELAKLR